MSTYDRVDSFCNPQGLWLPAPLQETWPFERNSSDKHPPQLCQAFGLQRSRLCKNKRKGPKRRLDWNALWTGVNDFLILFLFFLKKKEPSNCNWEFVGWGERMQGLEQAKVYRTRWGRWRRWMGWRGGGERRREENNKQGASEVEGLCLWRKWRVYRLWNPRRL